MLVWGSAVAQPVLKWVVFHNQKTDSGLRGLPAAAHLPHHVETQPIPISLPLQRAQGALTPRLCPKPVLGAGLAALM